MEINDYWKLSTKGISRDGWHVDEHYAHMFFFYYLRFSPSYALARKANTTGLSAADKKNLPKDFKQVLKTYRLLGDVHKTLYRYWWQRNGHEVFGVPYVKPIAQIISVVNGSSEPIKRYEEDLNNFLTNERQKREQSASLILSVPIDNNVAQSIKFVKQYLQDHKHLREQDNKEVKPKIKLQGQRFNANALMKGVGLLIYKSIYPEIENWRLGVRVELSPSYSPSLNKDATRRTKNWIEASDRILMGKITYRALHRCKLIAENAARGKFLCVDEIETAPFDFAALNALYKENQVWEEKELEQVKSSSK